MSLVWAMVRESGTSSGGGGKVKAVTQMKRPGVDVRGTILVSLLPRGQKPPGQGKRKRQL